MIAAIKRFTPHRRYAVPHGQVLAAINGLPASIDSVVAVSGDIISDENMIISDENMIVCFQTVRNRATVPFARSRSAISPLARSRLP